MATKRGNQTDTRDADDTTGSMNFAGSATAEMARQQLAVAADTLSMMFRAGESLQTAQLQMGQRAALLHSQAAENLRKATSPMELLTIQSTLVMYQFQEAVRYAQELMLAGAKIGTQVARNQGDAALATSESGASSNGNTSAAASMMGAAMNAAAPMAEAMQQMFTAPLKAASAASQQPH